MKSLDKKKQSILGRTKGAQVRTIKYPLDLPTGFDIDLKASASAFARIENVATGTLPGLVIGLGLAGFSLTTNNYESALINNLHRYDENAFIKAICDAANIDVSPRCNPRRILSDLWIYAGKPNTKDKPTDFNVGDKLYKSWFEPTHSSAALGKEEWEETESYRFAQAVGGELAKLVKDTPRAVHATLDSVLASFGGDYNLLQIFEQWNYPEQDELKSVKPQYTGSPVIQSAAELDNDPFAMHRLATLHAREAVRLGCEGPEIANFVSNSILSSQNNALDWLFNTGYRAISTLPVETLYAYWSNAPKIAVDTLRELCMAIKPDELYGTASYQIAKQKVGGLISSWNTNYLKRLAEIGNALEGMRDDSGSSFTLPEPVKSERWQRLWRKSSMTADQCEAAVNTLISQVDAQFSVLDVLRGIDTKGEFLASVESMTRFNEQINVVAGNLAIAANSLKNELKFSTLEKEDRIELKKSEIRLPRWLKPLDKIPVQRNSMVDHEQALAQYLSEYNQLRDGYFDHITRVEDWCANESHEINPLEQIATRERRYIDSMKRPPKNTELNPKRRAKRNILQRFAAVARHCNPEIRKVVMNGYRELFGDKEHLREFFLQNKGSIYRSFFNRSRHGIYGLDNKILDACDPMSHIRSLLDSVQELSKRSSRYAKDFAHLERTYWTIWSSGLPTKIPSSVAKPEAVLLDLVRLSPAAAIVLEGENVSRGTVATILNHYQSGMVGLTNLLFRPQFRITHAFSRVGDTDLMYVPKRERRFTLPGGLSHNAGEYYEGIIYDNNIRNDRQNMHWLSQAPHHWYYTIQRHFCPKPERAALKPGWVTLLNPPVERSLSS